MTEDQRAWKAMAGTAVRAAAAARLSRSRSFTQGKALKPVCETPGIEAWDSVSQVDSLPGTPRSEPCDDIMSAQTVRSSIAGEVKVIERIVREHYSRNREGAHNWHAGRLIG
jgi:hypothetical protein